MNYVKILQDQSDEKSLKDFLLNLGFKVVRIENYNSNFTKIDGTIMFEKNQYKILLVFSFCVTVNDLIITLEERMNNVMESDLYWKINISHHHMQFPSRAKLVHFYDGVVDLILNKYKKVQKLNFSELHDINHVIDDKEVVVYFNSKFRELLLTTLSQRGSYAVFNGIQELIDNKSKFFIDTEEYKKYEEHCRKDCGLSLYNYTPSNREFMMEHSTMENSFNNTKGKKYGL